MEIVIKDQKLLELYIGNRSKKIQPAIVKKFKDVVYSLSKCRRIEDLNEYKGLRYEKLKGNLAGYSAVRLNNKYRLVFREVIINNQVGLLEILEISNHYQ